MAAKIWDVVDKIIGDAPGQERNKPARGLRSRSAAQAGVVKDREMPADWQDLADSLKPKRKSAAELLCERYQVEDGIAQFTTLEAMDLLYKPELIKRLRDAQVHTVAVSHSETGEMLGNLVLINKGKPAPLAADDIDASNIRRFGMHIAFSDGKPRTIYSLKNIVFEVQPTFEARPDAFEDLQPSDGRAREIAKDTLNEQKERSRPVELAPDAIPFEDIPSYFSRAADRHFSLAGARVMAKAKEQDAEPMCIGLAYWSYEIPHYVRHKMQNSVMRWQDFDTFKDTVETVLADKENDTRDLVLHRLYNKAAGVSLRTSEETSQSTPRFLVVRPKPDEPAP